MALKTRLQVLGCFITVLIAGLLCVPCSSIQTPPPPAAQYFDEGQILFSPMWSTTTYLVNHEGTVEQTWESNYCPGVSVWWLGDGTILRTIRLSSAPGGGGGVQIVDRNGTILWDYRYNTDGVQSHHDVKSLPNGDVLLIAWEHKSHDEAIAAGRDPTYTSPDGLSIDHIIEVKPTGPTSGDIVWQWHAWDHLVQDYDPGKANYGVISAHPELIDINYIQTQQWDLMHTNSIDYNAALDQILISVCYYNEIWVIDHSTTTQEATGHTGGRYGHGGDVLYRWGNPVAYHRGTYVDQMLFMQHDATWVKPGCPGEGHILVFNNEVHGHSSVDEIIPPVNATGFYSIGVTTPFGPTAPTWSYTAFGFHCGQFGGAIRLVSGNTLITNGESGLVFEVTPARDIVWQYNTDAILFKVVYVPPEPLHPDLRCTGSLSWDKVAPGETVTGSFQVQNVGSIASLLNWTVNLSLLTWGTWSVTPASGSNLTPIQGPVTVQVSVVAPNESRKSFQGFVRVENRNDSLDYVLVPVVLKTPLTSRVVDGRPLWSWLLSWFQGWCRHLLDWGGSHFG